MRPPDARALALIAPMAIAALAGLAPSGTERQSLASLRFHHLHYRVTDPGAALGDAANAFQGTRTIQQGLGVGVRVGREYVLFDRESVGAGRPRRRGLVDDYADAVRWLTSRGLAVEPAVLASTSVARGWPAGRLDHIAFAAADRAPVLARIPATPLAMTDDRALFALPSGLGVEIVADTNRPDTWWCPMHPDIRSPGGGTCPICSMALVPIPPPRVGEYKLDVSVMPRPGGGASGVSLAVRDPDTGDRVTRFIDVHERQLHLFVISRDLERFEHLHPERRDDGTFELRHELPAGEYMLIADFLPGNGTSQMVQRAVVTPGFGGPLFAPAPAPAVSPAEQVAGGLRIRLEHEPLRPRSESRLRFVVSDTESNLPATDLEPYLGATGHLLIVDTSLSTAVHGHPEGARTSGPVVMFGPVFPAPGLYKMWVQFQRRGRIVTAPFVVTVAGP